MKEKLQEIFRDIFDDEEIVLFDEMTAEDIEDWNSLTHMQLIIAIEKEFFVQFTTEEILIIKNVGGFLKVLNEKTTNV